MKIEINEQVLISAIDKWGAEKQWLMVQEEAMELAMAIHKFVHRTRDNRVMVNLIDEIADVQVMIAQAMIMVGPEQVMERVEFKLDRLKDRVKRSEF